MERSAKTALLIIDMQEGSFTPRTKRHDTARLASAVIVLQPTTVCAGARVSG